MGPCLELAMSTDFLCFGCLNLDFSPGSTFEAFSSELVFYASLKVTTGNQGEARRGMSAPTL